MPTAWAGMPMERRAQARKMLWPVQETFFSRRASRGDMQGVRRSVE